MFLRPSFSFGGIKRSDLPRLLRDLNRRGHYSAPGGRERGRQDEGVSHKVQTVPREYRVTTVVGTHGTSMSQKFILEPRGESPLVESDTPVVGWFLPSHSSLPRSDQCCPQGTREGRTPVERTFQPECQCVPVSPLSLKTATNTSLRHIVL